MKKGKILIILSILGVGLMCVLVTLYYTRKNDFETAYHFTITAKVKIPQRFLILYNGKQEVRFSNYIVSASHGVAEGDSVSKEANCNYLYIFEKDIYGKIEKRIRINPLSKFEADSSCE